jgi:hypothetical protein
MGVTHLSAFTNLTMNPLVWRILRWSGYICIATGLLGALFGIVAVAQVFAGSADHRANSIGGAIGALGGGSADLLLGYGLIWISRSVDQPER